MVLLVSKVPFWEWGLERGFTICDTQKLCSAENTILQCFQQNTALQKEKSASRKNINLPKQGAVCQRAKMCFCLFSVVWWFCFFLGVFVLFGFGKKAPNGYFPAVTELFSFFCVPKRPVFKILLFFLFCFVSLFSFCPPLKIPSVFFGVCPSAPLWKILLFLVCLSFFFVAFPFMFACLFQTNFPNIPFLKPRLFWFLVVSFHVFVFVRLSCVLCFLFLNN